jgi:glycyl-tRNA synthetase beta chain
MFPVQGKDGRLLPWFLGVSNNPSAEQPLVRAGYEKVVAARLADGAFFWENDRRRTLEDVRDDARGITFLDGMGTVLDKASRIEHLSRDIARRWAPAAEVAAARAGRLCKADLSTSVVREFPELQGEMGCIHAGLDGEGEAVALAIAEHYRPRTSEDAVASTLPGAIVALADKLDTLGACFRVGKQPTGSADPFGLRRAAIGVLRTLHVRGLRAPLSELVQLAVAGLPMPPKGGLDAAATSGAVLDFLRGRLAANLVGEGHATEIVEAVLQASFDDVIDVRARIDALTAVQGTTEWADLLASWKRMANIVRKAPPADRGATVRPGLLVEAEERALWAACESAWGAAGHFALSDDYATELRRLGGLRVPLAAFFDKVMVMAKEDDVRRNRLALLSSICSLFERVAVFGGQG